jgi:hypothetical protein
VPTSFIGATEDAFDVHLRAEPDDVRRFGQLLTRLVPTRQRRTSVEVNEAFRAGILHR